MPPVKPTILNHGDVKAEPDAPAGPAHSDPIKVYVTTFVDGSRHERALVEPDPSEFTKELPTLGDVVGSHYKLTRLLGRGGFGTVYAAQRIDVPEHQVALKLLPRALLKGRNVERELVMLATVGHPHVVQLKDHGAEPAFVWLTMPVYEGETLGERLARGPLSLREAHDIFLPIARGLEALHATGLRHQDIKPENIFLAVFAGRLHPVLLDLGAAAERGATFVAGTLVYAAPEQALALAKLKGGKPLTEKMDTYSLGATILAALVGPARFPGMDATTLRGVIQAHDVRAQKPLAEGALPDLVGAPRTALINALRRWLSKDPAERPTMSQIADDLGVLLEKEREEARQEAARRASQKALMLRLRISLVAIVAAAFGVAWYGYSKRETLRLASELEAARREGADRFDKLDTCVASHAIERSAAETCRSDRDKDRAESKAAIDALVMSDSSQHAKAVQDLERMYSGRLRGCEDASAAAKLTCSEEQTKRERERDKSQKLADERGASLEVLTSQLGKCEASRAACEEELDPYTAGSAAPYRPPSPPVGRSSGGEPTAGPPTAGAPTAGAPSSTPTDTKGPPPAPTPDPPDNDDPYSP